MRIRAKANGNVIEANDEAARQLIDAGIYEDAGDAQITNSLPQNQGPLTGETVPPGNSVVAPAPAAPTESTKPKRRPKKA